MGLIMDKIVVVTGGFDPLHSGHLSLIEESRKIGRVIIGLNSDDWLTRKKGMPFQSFEERYAILSNLKNVLCVINFDDSDGSAIDAIKKSQQMFPKSQIVFANGGDRTSDNIPELEYCKENNVELMFGVGGNTKKNSSSWILSNWVNQNSENRFWGSFKTLYTDGHKIKVKELTLEPGKSISLQKHQQRNEFWVIVSGIAKVQIDDVESVFNAQDYIHITPNTLHKLTNIGNDNLKVLEVQHGTKCDESDIERFV
jgi:D-beta-D-heptose 7-phosphate kinase/D-beta-D-heptose 1-phosphate adenosyltransferase